ncbi:MAG: DUF3306 domain-containing protein [Rhodobacteraceae bacterium]|nr:DUF3306 domain-containing protein [Paracoccaceae bacterium]
MSAWASRKAAVQAEAEALENAEQAAGIAEQHAALAEKPEAEVLAELDLPNPDDMQPGDDFSVFMKETVPAALRNRALRTLWRSDPVLANVDMLVDYGEDFTGASDPVGIVKTIYRVGKGMLPDKEETEDEEVVAEAPEAEVVVAEFEATEPAPMPAPEAPAAALPPRRRMRFEFEAGALPASNETEMT